MTEQDLRSTRREYSGELCRSQLAADPLAQFNLWMDEALAYPLPDATAMTLATADGAGRPAARMVLLKHFGADGFCWYTDKRSPAGRELAENPHAELLFYWQPFSRQVRIHGRVQELSRELNDQYFNQRPESCRLSASVSHQSDVVEDRAQLENAIAKMQQRYPDGAAPRPAQWGGYGLLPVSFEFWQGRESRLHDRFRYRREDEHWMIERLAP